MDRFDHFELGQELTDLLNDVNLSDAGYEHLIAAFREIAASNILAVSGKPSDASVAEGPHNDFEEQFLEALRRRGASEAHFTQLSFLLNEPSKDSEVQEVVLDQNDGSKLVFAIYRRDVPIPGSRPGDLMRPDRTDTKN